MNKIKPKPKEILEKEKQGYIELTKDQIEKYIIFNIESGSVYFQYECENGSVKFGFKDSFDSEVIETKKCFGLFTEKYYNRITDIYLYNDNLKIFFNYNYNDIYKPNIKKENYLINKITEQLKNEIIENSGNYICGNVNNSCIKNNKQ